MTTTIRDINELQDRRIMMAVSYTHLTLPMMCQV